MPSILESVPDVKLLIAGSDPKGYGRVLGSLVRELALQDNVTLVGLQSDIPSFMHALDVFAFASLAEGFGQVLIEAMATRRAVVAANITPLSEIVADGETGLLVEPSAKAFAGALLELLNDPEKRARMGKKGEQRVRARFSAAKMAEETMAVYRSVC